MNSGYNSYSNFQTLTGSRKREEQHGIDFTKQYSNQVSPAKSRFMEPDRLSFMDAIHAERENLPPNQAVYSRNASHQDHNSKVPKLKNLPKAPSKSIESSISPSQTYKSTTCHYMSSQNPMLNSSIQSITHQRKTHAKDRNYAKVYNVQPFNQRQRSTDSLKSANSKQRSRESIELDVDALYNRTINSSQNQGLMMGSKEREYYQEEIARLTKDLNIQRKLTKDMLQIEDEFERCMKLCVKQEGEIENLKIDLDKEGIKSEK